MTYKGVYLYENTDSWREIWRDKTTNEEWILQQAEDKWY